MNSIKVSVIIPIYNEESHLQQCLDSVLAQTLQEIEVLCVDDGSTDRTPEMLQAYASKDTRVHVFRQQNQYAGAARNLGMKYARGRYLSFLDGDDYFEPDMLEKMYQAAESEKLDIVICKSLQYDEETGEVVSSDWSFEDSFLEQPGVFSGGMLKHAGIFQITKGWAWDKLFRAGFVEHCGYVFPDFRSSEDGFFVYMLMARARRMIYLSDTLITHRVNDKTSLSNTKEKNWQNGFRMFELIKEELHHQGLYRLYQMSFLNEAAHFFKWYLESMNSFEALKNCFQYMQRVIEPEFGILCQGREYSLQPEVFDWYQMLIGSTWDEYLYKQWRRERLQAGDLRRILADQRKALADRKWVFPFKVFEKGKTIILYGAGKIGTCYYSQLIDSGFCREVIWVDKDYEVYKDTVWPVQSPSVIGQMKYDYIFIVIKNKKDQKEIWEMLIKQGVLAGRIKRFGYIS